MNNGETNNNQINNVQANKNNSLPYIIIIVVLVLLIIGVGSVLFLDKDVKRLSEYAFNYDNVPYYINDSEVTISNTSATTPKRTTNATTKSTQTTTVYVSNTMPTTTMRTTTRSYGYTTSSSTKTTGGSYTSSVSSNSTTGYSGITTRTAFTTTTRVYTTRVTTTQAPTIDSKNAIKRTIMIYMVGSDLENRNDNAGGAASRDLAEISKISDKDTDVFVMLGGAGKWAIPEFKDGDILYFNNGNYSIVHRFGNQNMGHPSTLASFINFIDKSTDSEYYDLVLWNHGGGPIYGYGQDIVNNDLLFVPEIQNALKNTNFNESRKFEFIGFDACLMATVETAGALAPYANYLIASEETEYNYGWTYDKAFTNASKLDTISLGKQIINSYADSNNEIASKYNINNIYTLSLTDLSKVNNLISEINNTVKNIDVKANIGTLSRNRTSTIEFSESEYNLIDLYMFANLSGYTSVKTALKDAVVYSSSNLTNSNGLSIYLPYYGNEKIFSGQMGIYKYFDFMSDYYKFANDFYNSKNDKTLVNYSNSTELVKSTYDDNKDILTMELTDEQVKNFRKGFYVIFKDMGNGYYTPVYRADNGVVKGNTLGLYFNKKIVNFVDDTNEIGFGTAFERKLTNRGTQLLMPVLMQNWGDDFLSTFVTENGYLRAYVKDNSVEVEGIVPQNDDLEDVSTNKTMWQIEDWRTVQFWNFKYKILDANGKYTDDWEHSNEQTGFELVPYKYPHYQFFMNDIEPTGYYALLRYVDIYGNVVTSDLIPITN